VLTDPSYTENAKKVREKMLAYGGENQATQLISDFADSLGVQ
jgi:UDP:flavonoid glycosyltransferase YjiC (YdhE family)